MVFKKLLLLSKNIKICFFLYYFPSYFVEPAAGLFEGDIFADAPLTTTVLPPGAMTSRTESDDDMDHYDGGAPSPAMR